MVQPNWTVLQSMGKPNMFDIFVVFRMRSLWTVNRNALSLYLILFCTIVECYVHLHEWALELLWQRHSTRGWIILVCLWVYESKTCDWNVKIILPLGEIMYSTKGKNKKKTERNKFKCNRERWYCCCVWVQNTFIVNGITFRPIGTCVVKM